MDENLELRPGAHIIEVKLQNGKGEDVIYHKAACHCSRTKVEGDKLLFARTVPPFPESIKKSGARYYVDNVAADLIYRTGKREKVRKEFRCIP